ncbi:hypothetical protein GJ744_002876 [Endocarpon pusillum]|uniref:Efficient mitochondria targeting-associated protein 19 n=1 Tax=Endocarpon pusillum TaxID=364733 RepID=A0A8H7AAB3_9EURO|nr:hypothetical protein GJ744_002876 [Endocarpon pusillum]
MFKQRSAVVDLTPFYPTSVKPQLLVDLRDWYITTYKDRFFLDPPAFFTAFGILEAVYHLPLSFWAVGAILRDDPLVPLHLLVWSVETVMSTLTCTVEAMCWEGFKKEERIALAQLYVPYLVLAVGMGLDMFLRLRTRLREQTRGIVSAVRISKATS